MQKRIDRQAIRRRIRYRIRRKLHGTGSRPRLAVFRSDKHIYAQVIDDDARRTVVSASTRDAEVRGAIAGKGKLEAAKAVGGVLAGRLKSAGVEAVVFDRGGYLYHGRVKALAEAVRSGGVRV